MPKRFSNFTSLLLFLIFALTGQACSSSERANPSRAPLETAIQPSLTASLVTSTPLALATENIPAPRTLSAMGSVTPTPTLSQVTITAVNGDLAIRNGPDPAFDAIDILKNGTSASLLARSVIDGWVEIPIPAQADKTGWVSIKTPYSIVNGNVLDLPEIMKVEWPFGSYIRNCTGHKMLVEPTDQQLSSISDSTKNRVWFPPGMYSVYDLDLSGQPFVMNIALVQHSQVDIRIDGSRQRWTCP
jgi:hypothetical protein